MSSPPPPWRPTHAISKSQLFNVLSLSAAPPVPVRFPVESGCKDTTFFQTGKLFFRIFSKIVRNALLVSDKKNRFFPRTASETAEKAPTGTLFFSKIDPPRDGKTQARTHRAVKLQLTQCANPHAPRRDMRNAHIASRLPAQRHAAPRHPVPDRRNGGPEQDPPGGGGDAGRLRRDAHKRTPAAQRNAPQAFAPPAPRPPSAAAPPYLVFISYSPRIYLVFVSYLNTRQIRDIYETYTG